MDSSAGRAQRTGGVPARPGHHDVGSRYRRRRRRDPAGDLRRRRWDADRHVERLRRRRRRIDHRNTGTGRHPPLARWCCRPRRSGSAGREGSCCRPWTLRYAGWTPTTSTSGRSMPSTRSVPFEETCSALQRAVESGPGLVRRDCPATRLAAGHGGHLAARGRLPGRRRPRPSTRWSSGRPRSLCCPRPLCTASGCWPGRRSGRGVLTGKYRHGTPADSRGASPHFTRYVGRHLGPGRGPHRRGRRHGRGRAGYLAAGGGLCLGAGSAGGGQRDRRGAGQRPAAGLAGRDGHHPAGRDPVGSGGRQLAGRRRRPAVVSTPTTRLLRRWTSSPSSPAPACGPGSASPWPPSLAEGGITSAPAVTVAALSALPKMTPKRADRLYTSWIGAGQTYAVAQLLVPQGIPARWAGRLMEAIGDDAADQLHGRPLAAARAAGRHGRSGRSGRAVRRPGGATQRSTSRALVGRLDAGPVRPPRSHGGVASRRWRMRCAPSVSTRPRPFAPPWWPIWWPAVAGPDPGSATRGWPARSWRRPRTTSPSTCSGSIRTAHSLAGERAVKNVVKELDNVQAGAVTLAAGHGVSILTGGPGTGKSRTIAAVVALCHRVSVDIALAAPTGRAAKRLEELAGSPAGTIHRLLGARRGNGSVAAGFEHDADNQIEAQLVVVDEASMLDVELAAALLSALKDKTHLVIVGDPAQLPSIGPGRVLGDLIDSGDDPGHRVARPCTGRPRAGRSPGWRWPSAVANWRRCRTRPARWSSCRPADRRTVPGGSCNWSPTPFPGSSASPPINCRWSPRPQGTGRYPGAEPGTEGGAESGSRDRPRLRRR